MTSPNPIGSTSGWQPIDENTPASEMAYQYAPLSGVFVAPFLPDEPELSRQEKVAIYKASGDLPNVGFNPTNIAPYLGGDAPLPEPPRETE